MENSNQPPITGVGIRREPSTDPVKAQGILTSVSKKEKHAARVWQQRWGFLSKVREVQEEEAQRLGMSFDEYRAAVRSVSCKPEKEIAVEIKPSPMPLPSTSSGIKKSKPKTVLTNKACAKDDAKCVIGRRALCILERFGPSVKTTRDYPIRPPLPPGQVYNPYKQTIMFLGSVEGDPISYKLTPARSDVTDEMWARPQQLDVTPFELDKLTDKQCI